MLKFCEDFYLGVFNFFAIEIKYQYNLLRYALFVKQLKNLLTECNAAFL